MNRAILETAGQNPHAQQQQDHTCECSLPPSDTTGLGMGMGMGMGMGRAGLARLRMQHTRTHTPPPSIRESHQDHSSVHSSKYSFVLSSDVGRMESLGRVSSLQGLILALETENTDLEAR